MEELITFTQFSNQDAYDFGQKVIAICKQEKLKPLRIRVKKDGDIIFQYLMDGKTSELWLDLKENTVMKTGHSSMYVFEHQNDFSNLLNNDQYAICGGGYPLIINNELKGVFCISGLQHQEDHQLIIRALKEK